MLNYRYLGLSLALVWTLTGCGNTGNNIAQTTDTSLQTLAVETSLIPASTIASSQVATDLETLRLPKYINSDFVLPEDINWTLCNCGDFNLTDNTIMIKENKCESEVIVKGKQAENEKEFSITILPKATSPEQIVEQDIKMVSGNDFPLSTPLNSPLGIVAPNGSSIVWSIAEDSGYSIDAESGAITKNKDGKSNRVELAQASVIDTVTIVGTFTYADYSDTERFEVSLLATAPTPSPSPSPSSHYVVDTKIVGVSAHHFRYDSYGNMIVEEIDYEQDGIIDNSKIFINTYNAKGDLIEQRRSDIEDYWTWHYDEAGTLLEKTHTLPNGVVQRYLYTDGVLTSAQIAYPEYTSQITYITDSHGNVIEESEKAPFGTRVLHYSYTYDEHGNIIEKRGENGRVIFTQTWKSLENSEAS